MDALGGKTVDEYQKVALASVMDAVRHANQLPAPGDDFEFYTSYDGFRHFAQHQGGRIKQLIGSLFQQQDIGSTWNAHGSASAEDCADQLESLIEANDSILERVGIMLDEATGVRHAEPVQGKVMTPAQSSPALASWNKDKASSTSTATTPKSQKKLLHAKNVGRPQLRFKGGVDNTSAPFVPKLAVKPNAIVPLAQSMNGNGTDGTSSALDMLLNSARQGKSFEPAAHPYEPELLQWEPSSDLLQPVKEQLYSKLADTPLTYIDTVEQLEEMCTKLAAVSEIAIDLEAHSYRSFQGFTCLMQLSTRSEDFLVDTLALRSELVMLNEVFTDPTIVKVLHGSDSDVVWLQRDHSLYLVNMFDTGQAARVLEMPRFSLAYLLQFYCSVTADKKYQLADWRVRPLPQELINYAREDTHYLLYIYDRMRNELINKSNVNANILSSVWTRSRDLCLKCYEKPIFREESHLLLHEKHRKKFDAPQMEALRLLYAWRDKTARLQDESAGFVLPNEMLFQISQNLPRELQGILACCNPVPSLVRQSVQEIYTLVSQARLIPTNAAVPQLSAELRAERETAKLRRRANVTATPTAKATSVLKKADTGVPVREFSHGFAISGPSVPIKEPELSALAHKPCRVSNKSLLSPSESLGVGKVMAVLRMAKAAIAATALATPIKTPNGSTAAQSVMDTVGQSPVSAQLNAVKTEEVMDEEQSSDKSDVTDDQIWGTPTPRAAKETPLTPEVSPAAKQSQAEPLRSLISDKGNRKRKHTAAETKKEAVDSAGAGTAEEEEEEKFEPFDYEQVHEAAEKAAQEIRKKGEKGHSKSSAGQAKKKAFDPSKDYSATSFKAASKSRVTPKSGERSKTFSDRKSGSSVSWPKR